MADENILFNYKIWELWTVMKQKLMNSGIGFFSLNGLAPR